MHWATARQVYGEVLGLRRTRTHAIKYARIHPDPEAVRNAFVHIRTPDDLDRVLADRYAAVHSSPYESFPAGKNVRV